MINHEDWQEAEQHIAEAYATTCSGVLRHILEQLRQTEVQLSQDRRAMVEMSCLLEIAADLAREQFGVSAGEFITAAGDAYRRSEPT